MQKWSLQEGIRVLITEFLSPWSFQESLGSSNIFWTLEKRRDTVICLPIHFRKITTWLLCILLVFIFPWESKNILSIYIMKYNRVCILSCSVVSDSSQPRGLYLPSSSACGIILARILEWDAISFPRGSSRPRDRTWVSCSSDIGRGTHPEPPGKPKIQDTHKFFLTK